MDSENERRITSRELKAQNTRKKILKHSTILFLEKGLKGVTLNDILKATKLSKGAFYHHFASKEELFVELINNHFDEILSIPYEMFDNNSLKNFYLNYISYLKTQEEKNLISSSQYSILLHDAIKIIADLNEKIVELRNYEKDTWVGVVSKARENGEISSSMDDLQIANMFICLSNGVKIGQRINRDFDEIKALLDLWDSFYDGIKK